MSCQFLLFMSVLVTWRCTASFRLCRRMTIQCIDLKQLAADHDRAGKLACVYAADEGILVSCHGPAKLLAQELMRKSPPWHPLDEQANCLRSAPLTRPIPQSGHCRNEQTNFRRLMQQQTRIPVHVEPRTHCLWNLKDAITSQGLASTCTCG